MNSAISTMGSVLSARMIRVLLRHPWLAALLLLVCSVGALTAEARVGGGQSFSSGGGGGGGYSGGSGGGGGGDAAGLILWLLLEHPVIGIPTLIIVIAIFLYKQKQLAQGSGAVIGHGHTGVRRSRRPKNLQSPRRRLMEVDPGFSETLFIDFFQQVYSSARQLAPTEDTAGLRPWMTASALSQLQATSPATVREVIFGATQLSEVVLGKARTRVEVRCEVNLVGADADGNERQWLRQEIWTLGRRTGVRSPGPDRMRTLCCAACGDPSEPGVNGRCRSCDSVRTGGQTQWEVGTIQVILDRRLPSVALQTGGGIEAGTRQPTIFAPDLAVARRAFINRYPDFSWPDFDARVRETFLKMQASWAARRLEDARAYQTDALYQVHRFWMARYKKGGLINRMSDVKVTRVDVAKVSRDAWFDTVTVRIFASMRDWTERQSDGAVVGGSQTTARIFSEYWTFVRTIGNAKKGVAHTLEQCPSCGAPLDKVSMAGVCGYCDAKITGGEFDWVLSRIEQDEVYRG